MLPVVESLGGRIVRAYARRLSRRFVRQAQDCRRVQAHVLRRLLRLNAGSRFQRDHGITAATTIDELRRRVPIADYTYVSPYVEALKAGDDSALCGPGNPVRMFALSSGTTGETKFIPITRAFLRDYRRGWSVWGINAFDDHPELHHLKILQLASHYDRLRTASGLPCGNISGLVQTMQSRFFRAKYALPAELLRIADPAAKTYTLLRIALAERRIGIIITANPSTLVHLARAMDEHKESLVRDIFDGTLSQHEGIPRAVHRQLVRHFCRRDPARAVEIGRAIEHHGVLRPRDAWPCLGVLGIWTGGSARAYLPAIRQAYGDPALRDHGLSASEGRMTIPLADETASGVLDVGAHFFEFIPEQQIDAPYPETLLAHELEVGGTYYILLTTASGLHRYDIRDVVRCTGHLGTTPLLEFLHKGAHIANVTGEKVTESQVIAAVGTAMQRLGGHLSYYTVTPVWGSPPGYCLLMEEGELPGIPNATRLAALTDLELQQLNCEYADKRASGRLAPLAPLMLPAGTWAAWIRRRQDQPGGCIEQYKHPCLQPDLDFTDRLLRATTAITAKGA